MTEGAKQHVIHSTAGLRTQIRVGDGLSPQTFYIVSGVQDIAGPTTQVSEKDTTAHSTLVPHRTYLPTLIEDGQISFPVVWNQADPTHAQFPTGPGLPGIGGPPSTYSLEYLFQNRTTRAFKISAPDPSQTTRQFQGYVLKIGEDYKVADTIMRNVTLRITGAPSYTTY